MQVQYYSEIQPAFTCPDIRDVISPFLVWLIRREVTIQQVWRNVELMIAVRCRLVFTRSNNGNTVPAHQTPHATVTNVQADLLQLLCHSWTSVAAQTETRLFLNVRQRDKIGSLPTDGRAVTERTQSARAHIHHATYASDRKCKSVFFD